MKPILFNTEMVRAILKNEIQCVRMANACDRQCQNCELVRGDADILDAYAMAIGALRTMENRRRIEIEQNQL